MEARLKVYRLGPRGGRYLEASRIVNADDRYEEQRKWQEELDRENPDKYVVNIQDGNIRPRV